MGPETAGDEPFMMATRLRDVPVLVGQNRFKAGMLAVRRFNPDIVVLDDAFQHLKLERDIDLVLLDFHSPFGNTYLLPRGSLREPVSALLRADALILTRIDTVNDAGKTFIPAILNPYTRGKPVFRTIHVPYIHKVVKWGNGTFENNSQRSLISPPEFLKGRRVFAFSGLANNGDFFKTIKNLGCIVTGFLEFPDHHFYSDSDLEDIFQSAKASNTDSLITTEKDYVRIKRRITWPMNLVVLGIDSSFGNDDQSFYTFLQNKLKEPIDS